MALPDAPLPRQRRQLWYVPLLTLAMALMMLRMLVMARLLDVHAFAGYSAGLLVSGTFCMFGCLGLQSLLQREWPMRIVRAQERRSLVLAFQCVLIAAAGGVVVALVAAARIPLAGIPPALLAVGVLHGVAQQIFLIATVESRSRGDSIRYAWQNLTRGAIALALSAIVAAQTGSASLALVVDAFISAFLAATFLRRSLARGRLGAAALAVLAWRSRIRVPWRQALTLMAVMMVGFALLNVDRWVASDRLSAAGFATYSFAWIVLSIAQSAQAVINASLYPLLARRFAESGRAIAYRFAVQASLAVLGAGAVLAIPLGLALAVAVRLWYVQYVDALVLVPTFLAVALLRASDFWSGFLVVTGRESLLLRIQIAAALVAGGIWTVLLWPGAPGQRWTLMQIGLLPALISLVAYVAAAAAAWWARR